MARVTTRDSASMRTISILTLVFFPATFVSALFSTSVFDFQNWRAGSNELVASEGWWVYLLCVCALTVIVCVVWGWWNWWVQKRALSTPDYFDEEMQSTSKNEYWK
ncbi:hypothetical protein BDY21DRAFT_349165 [Lineolata rhizophorae]|uniref:Uncharacterized protein n=1 Tax=Lineolata rhizophorae TaxID=578093 RepID=A0A6A6NVZ0_9PEZI|nr:hypothetical protein BDY21DRAFT_349165 [Lineolata rhizophorae]